MFCTKHDVVLKPNSLICLVQNMTLNTNYIAVDASFKKPRLSHWQDVSSNHGVRHGFKIGGAKTIIELESEPKLILIYKFIKLSKILINAFKY